MKPFLLLFASFMLGAWTRTFCVPCDWRWLLSCFGVAALVCVGVPLLTRGRR